MVARPQGPPSLDKHVSLRFSVFEVASEIGLAGGYFDTIAEEDEPPVPPLPNASSRSNIHAKLASEHPAHLNDHTSVNPVFSNSRRTDYPEPAQQPQYFPNATIDAAVPFPDSLRLGPTPGIPAAALLGHGKLRKAPPPGEPFFLPEGAAPLLQQPQSQQDSSPPAETDKDQLKRDKKLAKEKERLEKEREKQEKLLQKERDKKQKDEDHKRAHANANEEEKRLLGGLIRIRTKSKERKTAAKDAMLAIEAVQANMPLPPLLPTPFSVAPPPAPVAAAPPMRPISPQPPLPIAGKFARSTDIEEVSFRPPARDSGSSAKSGSGTSAGGSSVDGHDYPRPRDRSSRFERQNPPWRNAPSSNMHSTKSSADSTVLDPNYRRQLPAETHTLPPSQNIFDRPLSKPANLKLDTDLEPEPPIDVDAINKYYGLLSPEPAPVPAIPMNPSSASKFALHQALGSLSLANPPRRKESLKVSPSATPALSRSHSPSPFIVPSPLPSQTAFTANLPTPLTAGTVTEGLDIPRTRSRNEKRTGITFAGPPISTLTPPLSISRRDAYNPPPTPPPATDLPPTPTEIAYLREETRSELGYLWPVSPMNAYRSQSPMLRAPSPLGTRSSSPNLRPSPSMSQRPYQSALRRPGTAPDNTESRPPPFLSSEPAAQFGNTQRGKTPAFPVRPVGTVKRNLNRKPSGNGVRKQVTFDMPDSPGFQRQRSARRSKRYSTHQGGYDSDDTSSRYSRDTYYGGNGNNRDTYFFDGPDFATAGLRLPPGKTIADVEEERTAGRDRLVRMFASGGGGRFNEI